MDEDRAVLLAAEHINLLLEALDSHLYWQVTPDHLRRDGHSQILNSMDEPSAAVYAEGRDDDSVELVKHAQEIVLLADRLREASR